MITHPAKVLLEFSDVYSDLWSRGVTFAGLLSSGQPAVLESLRQLTSLRSAISKGASASTTTLDRVDRTEKYLGYLAAFTAAHNAPGSLPFEWTSPLARQPDRFQRFVGIPYEHAMTLHILAAGLRQIGHEILAAVPPPPQQQQQQQNRSGNGAEAIAQQVRQDTSAAAAAAGHPQAAKALRCAAGIYAFLESNLSQLEGTSGKRVPELVPGVAAALQRLSLAEAQAVTAHRAELRDSSPALVAALHVGTADLLEAAAQAVKDALEQCSAPPERLKKALAMGWSLATARARRAWAEAETADGSAGSAVAGIDEGTSVLQDCAAIANEHNTWRAVWSAELAALKAARATADQLRESVHFQAVAKAASALPAGKCLVSPIDYEPPAVNLSLFDV